MSYEPNVMRTALARLDRRKEARERRRYDLERALYAQAPRLRELDAALRGTMADLALLAAGQRPVAADGPEIAAIRTRLPQMRGHRLGGWADVRLPERAVRSGAAAVPHRPAQPHR